MSDVLKGRGLKLRCLAHSNCCSRKSSAAVKVLGFLGIAALSLAFFWGKGSLDALGAPGNSWSFVTGVFMHTVDIDLEDKGLSSNQLVGEIGPTHEVMVNNRGAQSWIRIATSLRDEKGATLSITEVPEGQEDLYRKGADGYIYRLIPLAEGEATLWKEVVREPDNEVLEGSARTLVTQVEAVQAQNFSPNFEAESPWNDAVPEPAIWQVEKTFDSTEEADGQ